MGITEKSSPRPAVLLIVLGMGALKRGDRERAAALSDEDLLLSRKLGDKVCIAYSLLRLAGTADLGGRPERAARLWGALDALQETIGMPVTASPLVRFWYDYEGRMAAARSRLGEEAFHTAWAEGRAMSLDRAIEHALDLDRPTTLEESAAPQKAYPAGLSAREVEVLRLVAAGLTNAEVAGKLFISSRTVNGHLGSVYRKIGSGSRAAAARFAAEHGLT